MGGRAGGASGPAGGRGGGSDFQRDKKEYAEEMARDFKYKRESERDIKQFIQYANDTKNGITIGDDGEVKASRGVGKKARELAEKLADRMEFTDDDVADAYKDLRANTKGTYYINPKDRKEIDKFRDYQRHSKIKVSNNRSDRELDSLYSELYNNGANRYGLTNPSGTAAKLVELNNALSDLRAGSKYGLSSSRAKERLMGATRTDVVNEIHERLLNYSGMAQVNYVNTPNKGKKRK